MAENPFAFPCRDIPGSDWDGRQSSSVGSYDDLRSVLGSGGLPADQAHRKLLLRIKDRLKMHFSARNAQSRRFSNGKFKRLLTKFEGIYMGNVVNNSRASPSEQLRILLELGRIPPGSACEASVLLQLEREYAKLYGKPYGMARVVPGGTGSQESSSDPSLLWLPTAAQAPAVIRRLEDGIVWIRLTRFTQDSAWTEAWERIHLELTQAEIRGVIWDLRAAAGDEGALWTALQQGILDDSAWQHALRAVPAVVWLDRWTRGIPEAFADRLTRLPGAQVLTIGEPTFGFWFERCEAPYAGGSRAVVHGCKLLASAHPGAVELLSGKDARVSRVELIPHVGLETSVDVRSSFAAEYARLDREFSRRLERRRSEEIHPSVDAFAPDGASQDPRVAKIESERQAPDTGGIEDRFLKLARIWMSAAP